MAQIKLSLHEAIVLCMVREKRFTMTTERLSKLVAHWELWRRSKDGKFPEAWQVFIRANQKRFKWPFQVKGNEEVATVRLRCTGGTRPVE